MVFGLYKVREAGFQASLPHFMYALDQGNRIKIPPSFCIRQCGEDIFTTIITAVGNKWGIVCKKKSYKASRRVAYVIDF